LQLEVPTKSDDEISIPLKVRKGIEYVEKNHRSPDIRLADIASAVQMHPKSFSRLWSKTINVSVTDFVNELRIDSAQKMLVETSMYVSQIACEVGFKPKYFCTVFKARTGATPVQYRNASIRR
jgi:transcriptional regulator GlxA family with amidase domain